jgi:hypothetical protein
VGRALDGRGVPANAATLAGFALRSGLLLGRIPLFVALLALVVLAHATALQRLAHVRAVLLRSEAG